ncbi:MAG: SET domain-containing protein [Bacteroidia bacterium]
MLHPHTEIKFISHEIGYGVVATRFIPKGTITWVQDKLDRTFTPDEIDKLDDLYKDIMTKYTYRDNRGNFVLCWDNARFINHSFNSNCITSAYEFEIAVRDILPGEELTDDYGYLNVTEPFDALPEKNSRRRTVQPDDLVHFHPVWDKKLESAFKFLHSVEQPLQVIMDTEKWNKSLRISQGKEKMDSILTCYFDPVKQNGHAMHSNYR